MDSSQLRQKNAEEGSKQSFATYPGVMYKLEEPKVQR
jgi:hypothetical protein